MLKLTSGPEFTPMFQWIPGLKMFALAVCDTNYFFAINIIFVIFVQA